MHSDDPEPFGQMPEIPRPSEQRWTTRRKAGIVEAVRGGWIPIEEVCEHYKISVDEFLAWDRDIDRFGAPGLRATRFQIYHGRTRTTAARDDSLIEPSLPARAESEPRRSSSAKTAARSSERPPFAGGPPKPALR